MRHLNQQEDALQVTAASGLCRDVAEYTEEGRIYTTCREVTSGQKLRSAEYMSGICSSAVRDIRYGRNRENDI